MSQTLILASCFLPLEGETLEWWSALDAALQEHQGRLVMLATAPREEAPFPVLPLPYLLRHFAEWFPGAVPAPLPPLTTSDWDQFLLESDSAWAQHAYPPAEAWPGLLACRQVARQLLRTLAPGAVLLWNSTHPQTAMFHMEASQVGLPVYVMERGLLPGTVMLDAWGIQGAADPLRHWLAHDLPLQAGAAQIMEQAADYYLARRPQKYRQAEFGNGGAALRQQLDLAGRQVVVHFGQGDAAGLVPREERARRQNAPAFADNRHCLTALKKAVAALPNTALIFKPHPLDGASYADIVDESVIRVDQANVHALIDLADVVAAQFTTLQYETVFYDTPVLLLGRSAWWGRGCTYEVNQAADLAPSLRAALAREQWTERRARAHHFLAWALDQYLVGCHPDVPARHTLPDLAAFLARAAWDSRSLGPLDGRCWLALQQLTSWANQDAPQPGLQTTLCPSP